MHTYPFKARLSNVMSSVTKGINVCLVDFNATNKTKQNKQSNKQTTFEVTS
jgi:hypothetical protein